MRYPVERVRVASGYGQTRAGGVRHWGLDLAGAYGTVVYSPEAGIVLYVSKGTGTAIKLPPPLDGYGPGAIVIVGKSGVYHLLAHLDPASIEVRAGNLVAEGQRVATMPRKVGAAGPHTHWEVRTGKAYDNPATREANTMDPDEWVRTGAPAHTADVWTAVKDGVRQGVANAKAKAIGDIAILLLLLLVASRRR